MRINFLSSVNAKLEWIKLMRVNFLSSVNAKLKRVNFLSSVNAKLKQIKLMRIKFRWINRGDRGKMIHGAK